MKTIATNIAMPDDLWEEANILAIKKRVSFAELVRDALRHNVAGDHVTDIEIDSEGKIHPPEAAGLLARRSQL